MINRENLIKIGRAGGNTSNRETPDQIGRVGMSEISEFALDFFEPVVPRFTCDDWVISRVEWLRFEISRRCDNLYWCCWRGAAGCFFGVGHVCRSIDSSVDVFVLLPSLAGLQNSLAWFL